MEHIRDRSISTCTCSLSDFSTLTVGCKVPTRTASYHLGHVARDCRHPRARGRPGARGAERGVREDRRVECGRGRPTPAVRRARTAEHWLDPACSRWRVGERGERSGAGHQWHFPARRERAHWHAHTHLAHLYLLRPEFAPSCDDHQLRIMSYTTHLEAHHLEEPLTRVEADGLLRQVVGSASAAPSTLFNTPAAKASRRSMTPTHVGAWCPPSSHCARAASGSIPGGVLTCTLNSTRLAVLQSSSTEAPRLDRRWRPVSPALRRAK